MAVHRYIYALRGWLAFVAFMDLGTAIRCFFDDNFLTVKVYTVDAQVSVHPAMPRLFGIWSILNAIILLHCALCIHYKPIIVLTMFSLVLSILTYILEAFVFQTVAVGLSVIFPLTVNGATVVLLCLAPHYLWSPEAIKATCFDSDEEEEILKRGFLKRKLLKKKRA